MLLSRRVGEYTLSARLGGGRYAVCYLAWDAGGRPVVLKRFRARIWRKNQANNHHEAVILSALRHPAIPQLLGVLPERAGYFFILEYKPGHTLEEWLFRRRAAFSQADIFRIGTQLCEVLLYLHSRGVVHRDISIANVVDDGRRVALLDFGLARYADGARYGFALDYACFGDLLLFLLYSAYPGKGKGPWYDELPLSAGQRQYLQRLMGLAEPFDNTRELCRQFRQCFTLPLPAR